MTQTTTKPTTESSKQEPRKRGLFGLNSWQLKYQSDLYPLLVILTVTLIQFSTFFICNNLTVCGIVALVLLFPQTMLSIEVHNQAHVGMFRGKFPNWLVNFLLFIATGMLVIQFKIQHNFGHHCFYLDHSKDPASLIKPDGSTMSRWEFIIYDICVYRADTIRIGKSYPHLLNQFYRELWFCLLAISILLLLHPLKALILFVTPILLIKRFFIWIVYEDHIGLGFEDDAYSASHTKTNSLLNLLVFNNGYHLAHHIKPSLHWSKLPELHQQIESKITVTPSDTVLNRIFR